MNAAAPRPSNFAEQALFQRCTKSPSHLVSPASETVRRKFKPAETVSRAMCIRSIEVQQATLPRLRRGVRHQRLGAASQSLDSHLGSTGSSTYSSLSCATVVLSQNIMCPLSILNRNT